jgi:hypothetical protein
MKNFQLVLYTIIFLLIQSYVSAQDDTAPNRKDWWSTEVEYRTLGKVKLKRGGNVFFKVDYEANRKWHEYFPGVLRVENFRPPHHTALQFYNKDGVLQKTLSLEALNPFLNRIDKPISKGAYNFEVHEPAPDSMLTNIPEPDRFLTIFYDARTDPHNGNTVANYGLTAIHKNFVIYVKSASVIISPDGNVLNTLILDDASSAVLTSNDGTLIVYTYGGYLNNPVTSVTKQECRVYDFNRGKDVLRVQAGEQYQILGVPVVGDNLEMAQIAYRYTDINNKYYRLDLLDLNKRQRYTLDFPNNSFGKVWNSNHSYNQIIQSKLDAFDVTSF